jgi:signal transduction histidine kinase
VSSGAEWWAAGAREAPGPCQRRAPAPYPNVVDRTKITIAMAVVLALGIVAAAYLGGRRLVEARESASSRAYAALVEAERMDGAFGRVISFDLAFLLTGEPGFVDAAGEGRREFWEALERSVVASRSAGGAGLLAQATTAAREYDALVSMLSPAARAPTAQVAPAEHEQVAVRGAVVSSLIRAFRDHKRELLVEARAEEDRATASAFALVFVLSLMGLAAATGLALAEMRAGRRQRRLMQAWTEFLSGASHDLKTPLSAIGLQLEVLRRKLSGEPVDRAALNTGLDRLQRQTQLMTELVGRTLDVTRRESIALPLRPAEVELAELVRRVADRLGEQLERARCKLVLDVQEPLRGHWDPLRLEQLVTNLLVNASQYAPGTTITVRGAAEAGRARLVVADQGPGISPEDLASVFEPFRRLAPEGSPGHGLGLWIVRRIVEAHRGEIRIESERGRGTSFVIELPQAPPAAARAP